MDSARNWFGTQNTVTTAGGLQNRVISIWGNNNTLTSEGANSNSATNLLGSGNTLKAGSVGANGNSVSTFGSSGNTVTAGAPGNRTSAFAEFGANNTVKAGPGPFARAGSLFQNSQTVTKVNPGVAINNFRIGGASATASGGVRPSASTAGKSGSTVRGSAD